MRLPQFSVFFEGEGGAGAGAPPPSPPPSPAGAPPSPPPPAAAPPASATPPGAGAPPPGTPSQFTYENDRSNWLSPEDHARQLAEIERTRQQVEADRDRFRRMAEAAGGVRFPTEEPLNPAVVEARRQMELVYPGIGQLYDNLPYLMQMISTLQGSQVDPRMFGSLPQLFSSTEATWRQHGANMLRPIHSAVAQDLGLPALSERQARTITRELIDWIEEDRTGARSTRYANGDPALAEEFLTDYRSAFVHPLQRGGGGTPPASRPSLPPAPRGGGAPPPPAPPAGNVPKTLDEATDAAFTTFAAATGRR